jgi:hypothetical protein
VFESPLFAGILQLRPHFSEVSRERHQPVLPVFINTSIFSEVLIRFPSTRESLSSFQGVEPVKPVTS